MDIPTQLASQKYTALKSAVTPEKSGSSETLLHIRSFADTLKSSEDIATRSLTETVDPHVLVQALTQTELAVETAVTVRNKVVQAYQDILRMPI